jgi:outer membrane immunogenic protein
MRKHYLMLLAAATIGLAASQALAADLPRKAPPKPLPPPPPPITWTGCYIGGNVGGIFGQGDATFRNVEVSRHQSGFAGGGQIGCDYQFAGGWVIGIRNMFDGTSLKRDRTFIDPVTGFSGTADTRLSWFDTLTGRIGYAFAPSWLLYGQGGVAWAKNSADITFNGFDLGSFDRTRTGWTAGGGVEWMFARGWSAFLEGNYMDFGDHDHNVVTPLVPLCAAGCAFSTKATAATVLVGVNYRFGGWGGY